MDRRRLGGGVLLAALRRRRRRRRRLSAVVEPGTRRRDAAADPEPTRATATLHVCVACRRPLPEAGEGAYDEPGRALAAALAERLAGVDGLSVAPVECLAVCKRACTIALAGAGRWTYLVGDLTLDEHLDDIVAAAVSYAATDNGIIPWRERPIAFRRGTIARVPPLAPPGTE